LIAQGVPINGEAGVGYILEPGFHMPPLMLTPDEIEAVMLGIMWVKTRGEPELALAADRLITKLETVAPAKYRTSFLEPSVGVSPVALPEEYLGAASIRLAIRRRRKIALIYSDNAGHKTKRVIWPILLGYRDSSRIIAAWCEMREGFRYFRTERIADAEVLDVPIPRRMDILRTEWQNAMNAERRRYEEGQ
jgi:predicted DNA-binding transcriptional regulator YafY